MKRVGAALTWDGARWPARRLSREARRFLGPVSSPQEVSSALTAGIFELRICWIPKLRGGADVLCEPFTTPDGKRIPLRAVRTQAFGDVLGVVYRR